MTTTRIRRSNTKRRRGTGFRTRMKTASGRRSLRRRRSQGRRPA